MKNTHSVTKTEISVFGRQTLDAERRRSPSLADKVLMVTSSACTFIFSPFSTISLCGHYLCSFFFLCSFCLVSLCGHYLCHPVCLVLCHCAAIIFVIQYVWSCVIVRPLSLSSSMFGLVSLCGHYLCHPVCLVLCHCAAIIFVIQCVWSCVVFCQLVFLHVFLIPSTLFRSTSALSFLVWLYSLENPGMPYWLFNLDSMNVVTGLCHRSKWKSMIPFRVFCAWSASFLGLHIHFVRLTLANGPNVFQGSFNGFHVRLLPVIISDVVQPGIPSCPSQHPHFG